MSSESQDTTRLLFGGADQDIRRQYVVTPDGTVHLTPTELAILQLVEGHEGETLSKANIALALRRNQRVVGRLVSHLRKLGILESFPTYGEDGGQLANSWRIAADVRPLRTDEEIPGK